MLKGHFKKITVVILLTAGMAMGQGLFAGPPKDIVDTAISRGQFSKFVRALQVTGLDYTLKGPGPITVFAPTDAAFDKLPAGTYENLLSPSGRARLAEILKYHIMQGELTAMEAYGVPVVDTSQGTSLLLTSDFLWGQKVDAANIVNPDIECSNGRIHGIDQVNMPKDIVETLAVTGKFTKLIKAAQTAGMISMLKSPGERTLLAPTDDAFNKLGWGAYEDLLKPENRVRLRSILSHHIVSRPILLGSMSTYTLQGGRVDVTPSQGLKINGANVITKNIKTTNGIVQVIDTVLKPIEPAPTYRQTAITVIEQAIYQGVPLYNNNKPAQSAAVYENAAWTLLQQYSMALSQPSIFRLQNALNGARVEQNSETRSWILRNALDDVHRQLRGGY